MIYQIGTTKDISGIPHKQDFDRWRARLTDSEYAAIERAVNAQFDTGDVHTSSWIPGKEWQHTPYWPIYDKACNHDVTEAGTCFGLFVWVIVSERSDIWMSDRYELDGKPILGRTYFKPAAPHA